MGIETVAVYSEADARRPARRARRRGVRIGPAAARELPRRRTRSSTRPRRRRRRRPPRLRLPGRERRLRRPPWRAAGLIFVGPPPTAMRAWATRSRRAPAGRGGRRAGRARLRRRRPGRRDADRGGARGIGFPLLIKAAAGGGGSGMRVVRDAGRRCRRRWRAARREAAAAFGDDRVFLERLLERRRATSRCRSSATPTATSSTSASATARCSAATRRSSRSRPSPALDARASRRAGRRRGRGWPRAVGYVGAGTVEFLRRRADGDFYFLEMNARLQVEHPVTEAVTGVDLVRAQLAIAAGRAAAASRRRTSTPRGHAIECRLYAEDPAAGFLPAVGHPAALRAAALARRSLRDGRGARATGRVLLRPDAGQADRPRRGPRRLASSGCRRRSPRPSSWASPPTWGSCAGHSTTSCSGPGRRPPSSWRRAGSPDLIPPLPDGTAATGDDVWHAFGAARQPRRRDRGRRSRAFIAAGRTGWRWTTSGR